jgi:hypothetical protein
VQHLVDDLVDRLPVLEVGLGLRHHEFRVVGLNPLPPVVEVVRELSVLKAGSASE